MAVCIRPGDGASSAHGQMTVSFLVCRDGTIKTWGLRELRAFGVETYEEEEEERERFIGGERWVEPTHFRRGMATEFTLATAKPSEASFSRS